MAFTVGSTINKNVAGAKRRHTGSFSGGAPTAGEINTGLSRIDYANVTGASAISVSGGKITVTSAVTAGYWEAEGY